VRVHLEAVLSETLGGAGVDVLEEERSTLGTVEFRHGDWRAGRQWDRIGVRV